MMAGAGLALGLQSYRPGEVVLVKAMRKEVGFDGKGVKVKYFDEAETGEDERVESKNRIEPYSNENALKRNEMAQQDLKNDAVLLAQYDDALAAARKEYALLCKAGPTHDSDEDEGQFTPSTGAAADSDSENELRTGLLSDDDSDDSDDDMVNSQFSQTRSPDKGAASQVFPEGKVVWVKKKGCAFWPAQIQKVDVRAKHPVYTVKYIGWGDDVFKVDSRKHKSHLVPFIVDEASFKKYRENALKDKSLKSLGREAAQDLVEKSIQEAKTIMTASALGVSPTKVNVTSEKGEGAEGDAAATPADDESAMAVELPATDIETTRTVQETVTEITEVTTTYGVEERTTTRYASGGESRKRGAPSSAPEGKKASKTAKLNFTPEECRNAFDLVKPDLVKVCKGKIKSRVEYKVRRTATAELNEGLQAARFGRISLDEDHAGDTVLDELYEKCVSISCEHCKQCPNDAERKRFGENVLLPEAILRIHAKILNISLDEADKLL